jgi:phage shock protein A
VNEQVGSDASLQRAEELLERLRGRVDALEANADSGGDLDEAVDGLAEIAELAKEIEAEVQRARQAADAGA